MNTSDREIARARYAAERHARKLAREERAEKAAARELAAKAALARDRAPRSAAPAFVVALLRKRAPRLLDPDLAPALVRLGELTPVRPLEDWRPRGKGKASLFRSLAEHWLARFPMPAILWTAFDGDAAGQLVPLVARVAGGASFYDEVRARLTIPLTRAMCHDALATPAERGLFGALRLAQARAAALDPRLFGAWLAAPLAGGVGDHEREAFAREVLEWLARAGSMMDPAAVGPLVDYVRYRRAESPSFSMRGRSGPALLAAMRGWHADLAQAKAAHGHTFVPSGFVAAEYREVRRERGQDVPEIWRVREVLDARTLADEGKRMGHCVYSYAHRIDRREVSIWSVQMEDGHGETGRWHQVTVEVNNALRRVGQARGRFNRSMTPRERTIVARWASRNALALAV